MELLEWYNFFNLHGYLNIGPGIVYVIMISLIFFGDYPASAMGAEIVKLTRGTMCEVSYVRYSV